MGSRKSKRIQRPRIQPEMQAGLEQTTGLTVAIWPIENVRPYERNPRVEHDVAKIALSIREVGWTQQIVVDEEGVILAGHGRRLAAIHLGLDVVPITQVFGLSEPKKKAYRLMDNRSGEDSSWEKYLLIAELKEIDEETRALTGFGMDEIDEILADAKTAAQPASGEEQPAKGASPIVCPNCGATIEADGTVGN